MTSEASALFMLIGAIIFFGVLTYVMTRNVKR